MTDWVKPGDSSGEFKRQASSFRDFISADPGAKFPAEKGRYHLYVSYACPWACRTLIARKLKGLEDFISFSSVHWHLGEKGWRFATADDKDAEGTNVVPDPLHEGFTHIRDVYYLADENYDARFTVPVLFDKKNKTIVSNESSEILRMLGSAFDKLLPEEYAKVDLYPEQLRRDIDEAGEWTYDLINNGVYKSGFATTQEAYDKNVKALFGALDRAEKHLVDTAGEGPYWFGKEITETDIRVFCTIIRFDVSPFPFCAPLPTYNFRRDTNSLSSSPARLRPALQVQHPRHPLGLPGAPPMDARAVLEPPVGRVQGDDQLPAHQEPLHPQPHADQPALHHPRGALA